MTTEIIFASNKLGEVMDDSLQKMLEKFNLGKLISSERTSYGVMGQTMFVSSTEGEFVLKGNPLFPGQFIEEKYFVDNLEKQTGITVPVPYMIDGSEDIFGWSYSLMPRLQGEHLHLLPSLNENQKLEIAELVANTLLEFHSWKVDQAGELDTKSLTIKPFEKSYTEWLYNRIRFWLLDAKKYSVITLEDEKWVENLLRKAKDSFDNIASPTFVMGDFKSENFLLKSKPTGWEISGVFDFTNSYFGDGISDLIKMVTMYINNGEQAIARHLLSVYIEGSVQKEGFKQRIKVHMLQQRVLDWGCAKAMDMVTWDDGLSFSDWVEYYTESAISLLD
jgi:aminoglycoside phosphotransferase (APT) family kinase protein